MPTTFGGKQAASKSSGHKCVGPPMVSNIPPMTPPKPDGVPAPFPYLGSSSTATDTASKVIVGGGELVVEDSKLEVDKPGNQASQPAPLHDLVTQMVNAKIVIT
jgi:hypothetical protein